jgi:hypothetical protein
MGHHFHRRAHPCHTPNAAKTVAATFISLMIVLLSLQPACAISQNGNARPPTDSASQAANEEEHPYNGDDATRPLNLLQLRYTYKTAPGTTRSVTTHTITLRADRRIDLSPDWQLAFRTDLPMLATNPITSDNPDGHFRYGMGTLSSRQRSFMTLTPAGRQASGPSSSLRQAPTIWPAENGK